MAPHTGRVTIFPSAAVTDKRLGSAAFRVLAALGSYGDKNGWCFPALKTLADDLGVTRQAISKSIQQLVVLGYVVVQEQRRADKSRTVNRYRVVLDFDHADTAPPQPDVDTPTPDVDTRQPNRVDTPQPSYVDTPQPPEVDALTSHKQPPIRTTHRDALSEDQFARFWAVYPKRKKRAEAEAWFAKHQPDAALVGVMVAAIGRARQGADWQAEGGRFIPYPASWLNGRRWEDDDDDALAPPQADNISNLIGKDRERAEVMRRVLARRGIHGPGGTDADPATHGGGVSRRADRTRA